MNKLKLNVTDFIESCLPLSCRIEEVFSKSMKRIINKDFAKVGRTNKIFKDIMILKKKHQSDIQKFYTDDFFFHLNPKSIEEVISRM